MPKKLPADTRYIVRPLHCQETQRYTVIDDRSFWRRALGRIRTIRRLHAQRYEPLTPSERAVQRRLRRYGGGR